MHSRTLFKLSTYIESEQVEHAVFSVAKSVQPRACAEQRHSDPGAVLAARHLQEGRSFLGGPACAIGSVEKADFTL